MNSEQNQQKKGIPRQVITAVLCVISAVFILFLLSFDQVKELAKAKGMDELGRFRRSFEESAQRSEEQENAYDQRVLRKLRFLEQVSILSNDSDYEALAARYLEDEDFRLITPGSELQNEAPLLSSLRQTDEKEGILSDETSRVYYRRFSEDAVGVILKDGNEYASALNYGILSHQSIAEGAEGLVIAASEGKVINGPNYEWTGKTEEEVILGPMPSGNELSSVSIKTQSEAIPALLLRDESRDASLQLYYGIPFHGIVPQALRMILIPSVLFASLVVILVLYDRFLKTGKTRKGNEPLIRYKKSALAILGIAVLSGAAYYTDTMFHLSSFLTREEEELARIRHSVRESEQKAEQLRTEYETEYLDDAEMIASFLSDHPEQRKEETLRSFSELFDLDYIMIFDQDGRELLSDSGYVDFVISDNPDDQSYPFRILKRGVASYVQEPRKDELTDTYHQIIGVRLSTPESRADGFLQIIFSPERLDRAMESASLKAFLNPSVLSAGLSCFVIDADTGTIIYSPIARLEGTQAKDHGFGEESFAPAWRGYVSLEGVRYLMSSFQMDRQYLYAALDTEYLSLGRLRYALLVILLGAAELFVLLLALRKTTYPLGSIKNSPANGTKQSRISAFLNRNETWTAFRKSWMEQSAEAKIAAVLHLFLYGFAVLLTLSFLFKDRVYCENSIIAAILENRWPRGFNIFAFTAVIILSVCVFVAVSLIRRILTLSAGVAGPRAETMFRLLISTAEYISVILIFCLSLSFLGMDMSSLIAGAGIVTIVVGLGAKTLIMDILAGLFIIFEGDFQVGDIVDIGGYTGRVREIGIRTTKIASWDENVKVINNRNITSLINKTMFPSIAKVEFPVSCTVNQDDLSRIFAEELPKLNDVYPGVSGVPKYLGVSGLRGNRMILAVSVQVKEEYRDAVETWLFREIQDILSANEIVMG